MTLKKFLAILLAVCLVLVFVACGKNDEAKDNTPNATDPQPSEKTDAPANVDTSDAIGAFALIGEQQIIVYYDEDGKVVAITDRNESPLFEKQLGKVAAEATKEILADTAAPVATKYLLIIQRPGAVAVNKDFFPAIEKEAKALLSDIPVILSTAADQNELGYMSKTTAIAVLDAYLGHPDDTTYVSTETAIDGYYHISASGATTADFTVGALYGAVELIIDDGSSEGFDAPTDDYIGDDFITDGPTEDYTDPTEEPAA